MAMVRKEKRHFVWDFASLLYYTWFYKMDLILLRICLPIHNYFNEPKLLYSGWQRAVQHPPKQLSPRVEYTQEGELNRAAVGVPANLPNNVQLCPLSRPWICPLVLYLGQLIRQISPIPPFRFPQWVKIQDNANTSADQNTKFINMCLAPSIYMIQRTGVM